MFKSFVTNAQGRQNLNPMFIEFKLSEASWSRNFLTIMSSSQVCGNNRPQFPWLMTLLGRPPGTLMELVSCVTRLLHEGPLSIISGHEVSAESFKLLTTLYVPCDGLSTVTTGPRINMGARYVSSCLQPHGDTRHEGEQLLPPAPCLDYLPGFARNTDNCCCWQSPRRPR